MSNHNISPAKKNTTVKPTTYDAVSLLNQMRSHGASHGNGMDINNKHILDVDYSNDQANNNAKLQIQNQQLKQVYTIPLLSNLLLMPI